MKILLINENKVLLNIIRRTLDNTDNEVLECSDGMKAYAIIEVEKPDLVILDLIISYVTAYELISFIRSNILDKYIKIILLTRVKIDIVIENAFHLGIDDYIFLPLRTKELLARVERLSKYDRPNSQDESLPRIGV